MKYSIVLLLIIQSLILTCLKEDVHQFQSSGNSQFDSTAHYIFYIIKSLEKRDSTMKPSEIVNYMTSTLGTAEFYPPSIEYEADAAIYYKGPRPSNKIGIIKNDLQYKNYNNGYILITANDSIKTITLEAKSNTNQDIFYRWEWKVHN